MLLTRNSSVFGEPFDSRRIFEPEPGVKVKSKIEYMIYRELADARTVSKLTFAYEEELKLPLEKGRLTTVKPDFTVRCGGKTLYWEHLGMLDRADYSREWRERRAAYEAKKLGEQLVTTDDLGGVRAEALRRVIADLVAGKPQGNGQQEFSRHHYSLYRGGP